MAAACGINLPERMVCLLPGRDSKRYSQYESSQMMIRYTREVLRDISHFEWVVCSGERAMNTSRQNSFDLPMEQVI